jgi:hypothetical protein
VKISRRASVKDWLRVGCTTEALLGKYCTETVFTSGGMLAPVKE